METLQTIGMKKGWIYETIVSTYGGDTPNSAPIGVWTDDFAILRMAIFSGSNTLKNILESKEFSVNLVPDATLFHTSLFEKEMVAYESSPRIHAPVLRDASAVIEARLEKVETRGSRFFLESTPLHIAVREPVKWINRAEALMLESLILATRVAHHPGPKVRETLRENHRVVKKVAPGSEYERIMEKLVGMLDGPGEGTIKCPPVHSPAVSVFP